MKQSVDNVVAINEARPRQLPEIIITARQLRDITSDSLKSLMAANSPPSVFVRSGELVRLISDENGKPKVELLSDAALRGRLGRVANFQRYGQSGTPVPVHPPIPVVRDIEALGQWNFPSLAGVVEVPVLRPDGTILDKKGYDPDSRLYYHPAEDLLLPPIPNSPTPAEVDAALALIDEAIGEFPYDSPGSKANAIAALLTPIVRPAISGPVPLALLDAPQQGTGKSLLSSVIALTATGRAAAMMAAPDNDEEWRKRITATLYSGASVITIDNIEGQLKAPSLAMALTSETWRDRILGRSESVELPQRATWLATGNNIRLGGDMQRRTYLIRLDAQSATPWMGRGFRHPDLKDWLAKNRGRIVAALLILARAWFDAGRPEAKSPVLGSYEGWSRVVGGVLEHAGVSGFLTNLQTLYDVADEETAEWEEFLLTLSESFPTNPFTTSAIANSLNHSESLRAALPEDLSVSGKGENDASFAKRLGKAFSRRQGRRHGVSQVRIEPAGNSGHAKKWRVYGPPVDMSFAEA